MRIIQLLSNLSYGDAVSNDAIALNDLFKKCGYETGIYASSISDKFHSNFARDVVDLTVKKDDILMYHFCIGHKLNYSVGKYQCKKVMVYHNVTPPEFFQGINRDWEHSCNEGIKAARFLADKVDYCLADSEYNKNDLIKMGYKCPIDVLPIIIPFSDYEKEKDKTIVEKYKDGCKNIVFVGRIAPNKKQSDIVEAFFYYKKYYNSDARLFLVGNYKGMERYYHQLKNYIARLGVKDIYFTGHIKFSEILAYYEIADLFVCMSEHEGFCVPLVEAMYFNVPIIAYDSSAIAETLGGSGVLLKEKVPLEIAGMMNRILSDDKLKNEIVQEQNQRFEGFHLDILEEKAKRYIEKILKSRR
ncbi:glycosyltransferase family 4 protein [Clostridium sp. WB02_MRS01]|uniref:glycosyltransferase n=1 Tax=Clostridium sp. WB02_MRS01 TaxID=2605777 RepID=UPI0012B1DE32|nr:glycosyltransferase [Clostridium sp. WB02_MRS01]MSS10798.1 glycosyltransferase family 4 protein [Clostridium sp. WB02_MRS01]